MSYMRGYAPPDCLQFTCLYIVDFIEAMCIILSMNQQLKTVFEPKPIKPERKMISILIRPEIWEVISKWADETGYSRGQIVEMMVAEVQKLNEEPAA